jgi:sortase A
MTLLMTAPLTIPVMGADYRFSSGGSDFGTATPFDGNIAPHPLTTNTRRNKDSAFLPPPFGVFSGFIPTDPSSLFHNNLPTGGFIPVNQNLPPLGNETYTPGSAEVTVGFLPSTSQTATLNTVPWAYEDGSIGTLTIHKLNRTVTVFPGESQESMRRGAGHFSSTSAWDGNIGLAGHNRGSAAFFSFVKDLADGDRLTYTTRYGTRVYEVYSKIKISETDNSGLFWSANNILSLITCVENEPAFRWLVRAREVP